MKSINVSIVLFKNDQDLVKKAIYSCINSVLINRIYLIDNSPTDMLSCLANLDSRIEYIFNNTNLGFGKAHNIALKRSIEENIPYHLVLN
ncbi:MAG: glycosyltransferase, partial [Thermodesulfobacteriaceae bacterium]